MLNDSDTIMNDGTDTEAIKVFDLLHYPFFVGIAMFSLEGNAIALNVRASMKQPEYFEHAYSISIFTSCIVLCILGSLGYAAYGSQVEDIILLSLSNNSFSLVAKLAYCLGILGTYPIMMIVITEMIEDYK